MSGRCSLLTFAAGSKDCTIMHQAIDIAEKYIEGGCFLSHPCPYFLKDFLVERGDQVLAATPPNKKNTLFQEVQISQHHEDCSNLEGYHYYTGLTIINFDILSEVLVFLQIIQKLCIVSVIFLTGHYLHFLIKLLQLPVP